MIAAVLAFTSVTVFMALSATSAASPLLPENVPCAACRGIADAMYWPYYLPALAGGLTAGAMTLFFPPADPGTFHPFPGEDHHADHNAEDTGDVTPKGTQIPYRRAGRLQNLSDWAEWITESIMGTDPQVARPMTRA